MPAIHDATTGFHDIKALPDFPLDTSWNIWLAAAVLLLLIVFLLFRNKKPRLEKQLPPLTADDRGYAALRELERQCRAGLLSPREFSTSLSFTIRAYLESGFNFPATDNTSAEVMAGLKKVWGGTFPRMAASRAEKIQSKLQTLLAFCDRVSFGDDSEELFSNATEEFLGKLQNGRELITSISEHLARERAAAATVSDHSKTSAKRESSSTHAL